MSRRLPSVNVSSWWNDLMTVGMVVGTDILHGIFIKKIGNGGNTSFWSDTWVGPQPKRSVVSWRLVGGFWADGSGVQVET
jgi:hypothetical protein